MFICNMKLNLKLAFKIFFIILLIIVLIMCGIGMYRIFFQGQEHSTCQTSDGNPVNVISSSNYTNVLKEVHNNLNMYIGKKIKFTGFVYRLYDFSDDQFVLAREMVISSDYQGVIVGFLCHLNGANKYQNGGWVEVEGTITRGDYHGEIPVIEINKIQETNVPSDEYVYPPDGTYIQTADQL